MAEYVNKKTGAIISTNGIISGEHWELIDKNKEELSEKVESNHDVTEEVVDADENLDELTVPELKARLDEMGVTYPTKSKKQDLIDILSQF